MSSTTSQTIVLAVELSKARIDALSTLFPTFHFELRPIHAIAEIPDEIWQQTEILFTFAHLLPTREQAPRLRWVHLLSAGADRALDNPLFQTETLFTTSSGVHPINIAEYVLTTILAWYHRFPQLQNWQRKGVWATDHQELMPEELRGKTLGIVGYGSIGREIARQATTFGMHILALQHGTDPRDYGFPFPGVGDPAGLLPEHYYTSEQFHDLLQKSDVVVAAVPLTTATKYMFNAAAFHAMQSKAFFVNIARGDVCDEEALVRALQEKQIAGAALDVFQHEPLATESPLWQMQNVFVTPHITGLTPHYEERALMIFTENLRRYLNGESLYNTIDKDKKY